MIYIKLLPFYFYGKNQGLFFLLKKRKKTHSFQGEENWVCFFKEIMIFKENLHWLGYASCCARNALVGYLNLAKIFRSN